MALSPVSAAPAAYAVAPGASPRPDLLQQAGTYALAAHAPEMMAEPKPPVIDRELHTQLVEDFEAAEEASRSNREKAERDVDYYDGKQWTEEEVRKLRKRGQPPITLNLIREKIDFLQGLERTQRTRPRALPRTPMHQDDASSVGDALKFVVDDNRYNQTRSKVWKDLLTVGWGGTELSVEDMPQRSEGTPTKRIVERRCAWDRMFWDPYSSEDDFSDAAYLGMVLWMDRTDAVRTYGDEAGQVFDETIKGATVGGTFEDKPRVTTWVQAGKRRRVRVVQMYRRGLDGSWEFWEFTKGGILKGGPSPWLDEDGQRVHPFEWATAYVDRDNNRYGVVRDMIDPQDESNKRRSKALHHFTTRQTFGTPESLGGMSREDMRKEMARPDGHIELPSGTKFGESFGVIPTSDQAQGHMELLNQAMQVFQTMGPNASMQGKGASGASGRAILANQQGGAVQAGTLTDTLRDMDHRTYRKIWNAIRQFWTGETWVRVTDDEKNLKWVGLNTPKMQPVVHPMTGGPLVDPATGQPAEMPVIDPATGQPVLQNAVAQLDVDIDIDDAPDMGTMQDEQFALLVQLKQFDTNNELPFKALIEAVPNLRNKDKMLDAMMEREKTPDPIKVADTQTQLENRQADTANKAAQAKRNEAEAAKTQIEATHAHADRLVQARLGGPPVQPQMAAQPAF